MIDKALSNKICNMGIVCAMLVVLLHISPKVNAWSFTWCVDRFINDGLGRAAVPFFFVVSGFLLARHIDDNGWWRKAVCSRVRTLLVPHLTWNLLWVLMPIALAAYANISHGRGAFTSVTAPVWKGVFALPPLGPTWYLRTLFLFVLMSPLFVAFLKLNASLVFVVSFLLYALLYRSEAVPFGTWRAIPNSPIALEGLAYFLVGLKLAMVGKSLDVPIRVAITALAVSCLVTVFRMHCKAEGQVFLYNHTRFLVIPGFLWILWKAVPPCPWPKWLTSSAFAIYLIHPFAIFWFKRLASARVDGFAPYCACAVTAILVPIAVKFALLSISSRLTSFLFGGR